MKMATQKFILSTLVLFTILFIQIPNPIQAQELIPPTSIAELKSMLESEMKKQHVAGMTLTMVTKDSVIYAGGIGYADLEMKVGVTTNHLFRQASITKIFTALAVLDLVKKRKLSIETPLRKIAPEIPFENPWEETNPVAIGQLLEHSTGFADKSPFEEYNFSNREVKGLEAIKVFEKFLVSRWKPGERHSYAGPNYAILAYIIEKLSNQTFNQYLRENVFLPLGMQNSNMHLTADGPEIYSRGYVWKNNNFQLVPHQPQYNPGYGSLNANSIDLSHVLQAYLNDWKISGQQFLSKKVLENSETPHAYLSAKAGLTTSYGFGNSSTNVNGRLFRGHAGAIGGFLSNFLYSRELGIGYAFSINTHNEAFFFYADNLINQFITQHLPQPETSTTYSLQTDAVTPFLGYYRLANPSHLFTDFLEGMQNTFRLSLNNDSLDVRLLLGGNMTWKAVNEKHLLFRNTNVNYPHVAFVKGQEGNFVITDNTLYFKKVSQFEAWLPIIITGISIVLFISSLIAGIIWLLMLFFKKIDRVQLALKFSLIMASLSLLLIIILVPKLFDHLKECSPIYTTSILFNMGKYGFASFTLFSTGLMIVRWKSLRNGFLKLYLISLIFSSCFLLGILVLDHWYF